MRRCLARRLPALKDAPVTETRVCQYENTPNGDFLIDLHPQFDNVWLVGGGSGHGFKHGPVVGDIMSPPESQAIPRESSLALVWRPKRSIEDERFSRKAGL